MTEKQQNWCLWPGADGVSGQEERDRLYLFLVSGIFLSFLKFYLFIFILFFFVFNTS